MNRAFSITFRPQQCNTDNNYALQDKDGKTLTDFILKYKAPKVLITEERPGTIEAHLHCAVLFLKKMRQDNLRRQLLNRFKKYIDFKIVKGFNPAIKIKPHPEEMLNILAGGYLLKEEGHKLILQQGFTNEELKQGSKDHKKFIENKSRVRKIELHNKNFIQKLDDYLFMNEIEYSLWDYKKFISRVIPRMLRDNYIFSISIKNARQIIKQFISVRNESNMAEYMDEWEEFDSKLIMDKEQYIKLIKYQHYNLD